MKATVVSVLCCIFRVLARFLGCQGCRRERKEVKDEEVSKEN